MRRLVLFAIAAAAAVQADPKQEVTDLFASMASALTDANPRDFLRAVDPATLGYERLAANIRALATENAVSNEVEITSQKGNDHSQEVELDWLLDIKGIGQSGVSISREAILKCRLERRGKKWRIVALDPLNFFAPPGAEGDR